MISRTTKNAVAEAPIAAAAPATAPMTPCSSRVIATTRLRPAPNTRSTAVSRRRAPMWTATVPIRISRPPTSAIRPTMRIASATLSATCCMVSRTSRRSTTETFGNSPTTAP